MSFPAGLGDCAVDAFRGSARHHREESATKTRAAQDPELRWALGLRRPVRGQALLWPTEVGSSSFALAEGLELQLLDEPSLRLSPKLVAQDAIVEALHRAGIAILVVEQNAQLALTLAAGIGLHYSSRARAIISPMMRMCVELISVLALHGA